MEIKLNNQDYFFKYNSSERKLEEIAFDKINEEMQIVACVDGKSLEKYKQAFGIKQEIIDCCKNVDETFRSRVDVHDEYIFTDLKILEINPNKKDKDVFALYIKKNLLLLIDIEDEDDSTTTLFGNAIDKINSTTSGDKNNSNSCPYERLIYNFFISVTSGDNAIVETYDKMITDKELNVIQDNVSKTFPEELLILKQDLNMIHNYYEQILDITDALQDNDNDILNDDKLYYISRITRIVSRLRDDVANMRNDVNHLQDSYSTHVDTQMNKTMEMFTVVSILFLPLTFLTGWFGMNFVYMPITRWKYGYFVFIPAVVVLVAILLIIAIHNNWIRFEKKNKKDR